MLHHYCSDTFNIDDQTEMFSTPEKTLSLKCVDTMAKEGLIPVSYGYKKLELRELRRTMKDID